MVFCVQAAQRNFNRPVNPGTGSKQGFNSLVLFLPRAGLGSGRGDVAHLYNNLYVLKLYFLYK